VARSLAVHGGHFGTRCRVVCWLARKSWSTTVVGRACRNACPGWSSPLRERPSERIHLWQAASRYKSEPIKTCSVGSKLGRPMSYFLSSDLFFDGSPASPSIFSKLFGEGQWGEAWTGEYADDKTMICAPYERVWVFDEFPDDPFGSWLCLANQFDRTGWWPVFMDNEIDPAEIQEFAGDGSGLDVTSRGVRRASSFRGPLAPGMFRDHRSLSQSPMIRFLISRTPVH
jgi:hypothetical protein